MSISYILRDDTHYEPSSDTGYETDTETDDEHSEGPNDPNDGDDEEDWEEELSTDVDSGWDSDQQINYEWQLRTRNERND